VLVVLLVAVVLVELVELVLLVVAVLLVVTRLVLVEDVLLVLVLLLVLLVVGRRLVLVVAALGTVVVVPASFGQAPVTVPPAPGLTTGVTHASSTRARGAPPSGQTPARRMAASNFRRDFSTQALLSGRPDLAAFAWQPSCFAASVAAAFRFTASHLLGRKSANAAATAATQPSAIVSQRPCVPWQRPAFANAAANVPAAAASQAARSEESAFAATVARQRSTAASRTPTPRSFAAAHLSAAAAALETLSSAAPASART
jgi:hypothetical protein